MLNRIRKLGLQILILGSFFVVLTAGMVAAVVVAPTDVESTLTRDLVDRGHAFLEAASAQAVIPLRDGRTDTARAILIRTHAETLQNELDAAAFYPPRKDVETRPDLQSPYVEEVSPTTNEGRDELKRAIAYLTDHAADFVFSEARSVIPFEIDGHPALAKRMTLSTNQGSVTTEKVVGYAVAVLHPEEVQNKVANFRKHLALTFLVIGGIFLAVVFVITQTFVLRPLLRMRELASRIGEGDLTGRVRDTGPDELGVTAEALNKIAESMNVTLAKVKSVSDGVSSVMQNISRSAEVVSRGAATSQESVRDTSSSMEEMIASLKGIASNVEVLAQSAEESSSSILEMAATNDEVAENIVALAASVEETTSAIEQMTFSIREVAKNVEDLNTSTEETSSSMNEMDVSIGQVEMNATETSKLAELVSSDAASGVVALKKTMEGIEKIKESSRTAADVIDSLGRKILTIGNILNVIDDVAEQTNLLALNAAIIAAQAGEHGKGFAVVADEIKDLAERTGASTKEIADLIKSVQDESRNAVNAMERGVKSVEEGVRLGTEAEGALKKILESSNKASQMVKAIARATVEQSRGSKQVTNAINRIAETVQQIAKATAEQAKGSEQIMKSAEKMKVITKHVERSSQEQARGSKSITKSIENISEMVNQLNKAQKEQTRGSESVLGAMENIKRVSDSQHTSMRELERAIDQLAEQSEVLRSEVRRFRV